MSEKSELISRLKNRGQSRYAYIRAILNVLIPAQIKGLRFKRGFTQKALADLADMKQSRISTMESPGATKFNIETLIRTAAALKVGLKVQFVSFSEMLEWENGFNQTAFNPVTIDEDREFSAGSGASAPEAQIVASESEKVLTRDQAEPVRMALPLVDFGRSVSTSILRLISGEPLLYSFGNQTQQQAGMMGTVTIVNLPALNQQNAGMLDQHTVLTGDTHGR